MTFYNIIFGFLFISACQQVLRSIGTDLDPWLLALVAVLIFTDAVNTSEAVEGRGVDYSIWMKLCDLASFFVLSATLIVLSGAERNIVDVEIYYRLPEWMAWIWHPVVPPLLLLAYCGIVYLWIKSSRKLTQPAEWPPKLRKAVVVLLAMLAVILVSRIFGWQSSLPLLYTVAVIVAIGGAFVYLVSYTLIPKPESRGADKIAKELHDLATEVAAFPTKASAAGG